MSTRREAREWAVQILFQLDLNPNSETSAEEIFREFWNGQLRLREDDEPAPIPPEPIRKFTESLVMGVLENREAIDKLISSCVKNWNIQRIGGIERNVLRMGIFELAFAKEKTPQAVVINESVDISKFFGTRESGRFVNGVLDSIAKNLAREAAKPQEWSPGT
ncbi:MAG: transcription antitermination factor NusB [Kiritimatiellia bacterium]|jgi:N utilization substance protein B